MLQGAGVSSALIAVISRKLELSRAEKHVNNFMADSKLTNQRKNAAAAVLQHTWFIHRYQRTSKKGDDMRLRQHQRKFLNAINEFRCIKWNQRKLQEKVCRSSHLFTPLYMTFSSITKYTRLCGSYIALRINLFLK